MYLPITQHFSPIDEADDPIIDMIIRSHKLQDETPRLSYRVDCASRDGKGTYTIVTLLHKRGNKVSWHVGMSKRHPKLDRDDQPEQGFRYAFGRAVGAFVAERR